MKKIILTALLVPAMALAQTYPSPTFNSVTLQNPLTPGNGGTGVANSSTITLGGNLTTSGANPLTFTTTGSTNITLPTSGTLLSTGTSTGTGSAVLANSPTIASPTITGAFTATGLVTTADLAAQAANTVLANATTSSASPTAFSMPGCSTSASALTWTSGTGFTCNASVNAATLGGATFATPGPIGSTTASTAAFTALSASGVVSGAGFSAYLASPPAIGGTAPNTGSFSSLTSNNGLTTATSIYQAMFPGQTFSDQTQAVFQTPSTNSLGQMTAFGSYIRNVAPVSGINGNAVALFGAGTAEVNNAATWGVNTLLQDASSRAAGTGTGRILIGHEADFNVMNPNTEVIGFSAGGNSLAQSTNANAFIANNLGTGYKWSGGFITSNGAATTGLSLGMSSVTLAANVNSQPAVFQIGDGNGVAQNVSLTGAGAGTGNSGGFLILGGTSAQNNLSITNGNIALGSASGVVSINGIPAIGSSTARLGANNNSGQAIPNGVQTTVTGWTKAFDQTNSFNTSTGLFTAPFTAYYHVEGTITFSGASFPVGTTLGVQITKNGSSVQENIFVTGTAAQTGNTLQISGTFPFTAGQTIGLTVYQNSGSSATLTNSTQIRNTLAITQLPG